MYKNWNKKLEIARKFRWYKLDTIIDALHKLQDTIFYTPGKISINYKFPLETIQGLFDKHQRFPKDSIYICEGIGEWKYKLDGLLLTYSLIAFPNRLERHYWDIETKGDAEILLLTQIGEILNFLEQYNDTFDRDDFENYYVLEWCDQDNLVDTLSSLPLPSSSTIKIPRSSSSINPTPTSTSTTTTTATQPILTSRPFTTSSSFPSFLNPNPSLIFLDKSNTQPITTTANNHINNINSTVV